jgi:hypothetical protein
VSWQRNKKVKFPVFLIIFFRNQRQEQCHIISEDEAIVPHAPKRTPPHTNNAHEQCAQQDTTPPKPGRRAKRKPLELAPSSPTLCHDQSRNPLQAQVVN